MARSSLHQLTRLEIANARPAARPYTLSDGGRLYVLVKPDCARLWRWNYDFAGKARTMAFGRWPEVSEKEARAAYAAARELLRQGVDPMQKRREDKRRSRFSANAIFEAVAKAWIVTQAVPGIRSRGPA